MSPEAAAPSFSARLQARSRQWWGKDQPLSQRLHRLAELNRRHRVDQADKAWHCCPLWQRTLANKLNGKTFARRYGARVAETYWQGRRPRTIPWSRIPDEFVIKPAWGLDSRGVQVVSAGREQIRDVALSREEVISTLGRSLLPRWVPLIAEEHVRRPDGSWGESLEYKFHVFRDQVGAITAFSRQQQTLGFYDPDWQLLPEPYHLRWPQHPMQRPGCLDEMKELAVTLGRAYGSYVRVDLFWTDEGCVFNELSSTPAEGRGLTAFADDYLGDCWLGMLERFPGEPSD